MFDIAGSLRRKCNDLQRIDGIRPGDGLPLRRYGHGEVFSETRKQDLEAFLGNRYPASDIPQIARRLYERNRVRLLPNIEYTAAPLAPRLSPISGEELDMSLCFLRSVSPSMSNI